MTATQDTKEQAQQTASSAADESRRVAGVAAGEAQKVAGEAKQQARGLVDEALSQVHDQSRTQRDRLVTTLHSLSDDLEQMASGESGSGLAADAARQVAGRARALTDHLDGREPSEILDDVRRFARDRPGTFLLGALAAGVVAGRLARGAKAASSSSDSPYDDVRATPATPSAPVGSDTAPAPLPVDDGPELSAPPAFDPLFPERDASGSDAPGRYAP